ncbi:hypothetical protein PLICRDRAFT_54047 [Plicaturopsis crispa FD-325 SS-3]|nr:hypothetical protein PLICRDRAFT_54047 [Plicaturopsis crispa FD-325 SS-3]
MAMNNTSTTQCTGSYTQPLIYDIEHQLSTLRIALEANKATETDLIHRLNETRATGRSLQAQIDAVYRDLRQARNRSAPIHRLPVEIIVAIFREAQPHIPNTVALHTLAAVSRDWRAITIGTPFLWSSLKITHRRPLELFKIELERSCPLSVDIAINSTLSYHTDIDETRIHEAYDLIVQNMERVRSLSIRASKKKGLRLHLNRLRSVSAPALSRLTIACETDEHPSRPPGAWVPPPAVPLFEAGPPRMLARLSMRGTSIRFCLPPLHGITTLQLNRQTVPLDVFHGMLTSAPSLSDLSLDDYFRISGYTERIQATGFSGASTFIESPLLPVQVPSLRILRLSDIHDIWQMISSPQLETLVLGPKDGTTEILSTTLVDSLMAMQGLPRYPYLRSLEFRRTRIADIDVPMYPCANMGFPSITHVGFSWRKAIFISDDLLSIISPRYDSSVSLPFVNLQTVTIDVYHHYYELGILCDIVERRARVGGTPLKLRVHKTYREALRRFVEVEIEWDPMVGEARVWDVHNGQRELMQLNPAEEFAY